LSKTAAEVDNQAVDFDYRYQQIKKVTVVGAIVNIFLAFGKITLGYIGQSQVLVADGVHSLADLVSDLIVIVAAKQGSRKADADHPYGHGRIETVVEVLLGIFLVVVAAVIMVDAVSRLSGPTIETIPTWFALVAAFFSIAANEGLYHYTIQISKKVKSQLLKANAWHHRTDAVSSVIAVIGIGGAMLGFPMLDSIAAIGVSLLIAKVGWDISWRSLRELVDTAIEPEKVKEVREIILSVDGVRAVHSLRTRSMGAYTLVDVHILVSNSRISVSEGHQISERVMRRLLNEIDEVSDVTVHIDPEDDEVKAVCTHLPLRNEVLSTLDNLYAENTFYQKVIEITLHYLDGKIYINIILPIDLLSGDKSAIEIVDTFKREFDAKLNIAKINVRFG